MRNLVCRKNNGKKLEELIAMDRTIFNCLSIFNCFQLLFIYMQGVLLPDRQNLRDDKKHEDEHH